MTYDEVFYAELMDILDEGVKEYDDYICTIQSRVIGYEDGVNLARIHDAAVEKTRKLLDAHTELATPETNRPLENGMIADILLNIRFLWYIWWKCGDRKRGWVVACHNHIYEVVKRSEVPTNDVTTMPEV